MIRVTSSAVPAAAKSAQCYRLAGQSVVIDTAVNALQAYQSKSAQADSCASLESLRTPPPLDCDQAVLRYQGHAPVANSMRYVQYWRTQRQAQIDIDGHAICHIDFEQRHIHLLNHQPLDTPTNLEVVTGPALILLLAESGVFCLHAGAVSSSVGNIGFIAESGVGKSTLAAHQGGAWRQIADDIVPLTGLEQPLMLPDFPQLKLPDACVAEPYQQTLALDFLLQLKREPSAQIRFERLARVPSMLQLVRHTVATKLFDDDTLQRHSSFAERVTARLPVIAVHYPRDHNLLPELRERIVGTLSRL